jgi:RimJ/RimL family protein N-acetyltransferase
MIRKGAYPDLLQIAEFDTFSGSRSNEINEDRLSVFEENGIVIGFIVESINGLLGRPYIQYLAVNKFYRRNGVALTLLKAIESKHSSNRLFISTEASNTAMLRLLESSEYTISGKIENANISGADEIYFYKNIA